MSSWYSSMTKEFSSNAAKPPFVYKNYNVNNSQYTPSNIGNNNTLLTNRKGFNTEFKSSMGSIGNTLYESPLAFALGNIKNNYTKSLAVIKSIVTLVNDSDKKNKSFESINKDLIAKRTQLSQLTQSEANVKISTKYNNQINTMLSTLYDTSVAILKNNVTITQNVAQLQTLSANDPLNSGKLLKIMNKNIISEHAKFSAFFKSNNVKVNLPVSAPVVAPTPLNVITQPQVNAVQPQVNEKLPQVNAEPTSVSQVNNIQTAGAKGKKSKARKTKGNK